MTPNHYFCHLKSTDVCFFYIVYEKTIDDNKYAVILDINCARNHRFAKETGQEVF